MISRSPYSGPVCKGDWALGTACGTCERCLQLKPIYEAQTIPTTQAHQARLNDLEERIQRIEDFLVMD